MRAARWAALVCVSLGVVACTSAPGPTDSAPGSASASAPGSASASASEAVPETASASLPPGAAPILFVHGYGTSAAVFDTMLAHLRGRGYPPSYLKAVELQPNDGSNVHAATREIAPAVEGLVAAAGGDPTTKVDMVAHSMGALSGRWYAAKLRPERVRTLLTIAGANHGTDALCGNPTAGSFDLCPAFAADPEHVVQIGLNGRPDERADETPYGIALDRPGVRRIPADDTRAIRYVAVLIPNDQWIRPPDSSALAGADPVPGLPPDVDVTELTPGNLLFREPTDHDKILENERFFVVLDALLFARGGE